jgi:thioredoxin reductase (NADPH)
MLDVAIIGGGPGGLSAGIYAVRAGLSVKLFERALPGGQMTTTEQVENYLGFPDVIPGPELVDRMVEHAGRFGIEPEFGEVGAIRPDGRHFVLEGLPGDPVARTVLIVTGSKPRELGVPGEQRFRGAGVSYCATCDGFFFRGKRVAVVGGGDAACEESLYLARICESVTIIHRRDELRAVDVLKRRATENERISFVWDTVVDEIAGERGVESLRTRNVKTGEEGRIEASGIFIYVGSLPNSEFVKDLVELDEQGYIVVDKRMATSRPGIFAAGDVRSESYRQIAAAVGDGCVAALSAARYIMEEG